MPKVFVAENVKGLTIGKARSILGSHELDLFNNQDETILHGLMNCGYVVRWQILNAADYGTPQTRQRVFFIGVRKDLNLEPCFPIKQGYQYSVLDALPHLAGSEVNWADLNGHGTSPEINKDKSAPCISKRGYKDSGHKTFVKIINVDVGGHSERRGQEISADKPITTLMAGTGGRCGRGTTQFQIVTHETHGDYFSHGDVTNKPLPTIRKDKTNEFQIIYGCNTTGKPTKPNKTGNSFPRDLIEPVTKPIKSVTKSGSGMGGTSCMVQEGETKRKFTIQELKRLGGFPDDYILTGSYSKQWEIIGNSVCPPQLKAVADCLYDNIFLKLR
jgi:DNA (cytosine-5)-methyltransferase 1